MSRPHPRPTPPSAALRSALAFIAVAALLLLWPAPGAHSAPRDEEVPLSPQAIDRAIEQGVDWLCQDQDARGTWGGASDALGPTALVVLALLHCGLREQGPTALDRRLRKSLAWLDENGPGRATRRVEKASTYATALLLMVLRERGRPQDRPRMQALTDHLVTGQARNGQWSYELDAVRGEDVGDHSNTQFAVLALGAAISEGLRVDAATLSRTRQWWIGALQSDGGFGYSSGGSLHSASTGSMTAAGIACLAILDAAQQRLAATPARLKAQAFLAEVFRVDRNHGPSVERAGQRQRDTGRGWLHYYLWTVERAMVLAEVQTLGAQDWYALGATRLLRTQQKDGSWRQERPLYATCFALLFLTRAADPPRVFTPRPAPGAVTTPAPSEGAVLPPLPTPALDDAAARQRVSVLLDQPLSAGERAAACREAGSACLLALVEALDAPDRERRRRAHETLVELLPEDRLRAVDRHPLPRGRLHHWLRRHGRDLALMDGKYAITLP